MTEEVREYVEIKSNSSDETSIELKIPQAQSLNYLAYNCLASLEFMISTIILIFYVALNTSTTLIVLSGLGLLALSAGCLLSFFAVSKLDPKKQTYALIAFCVASLLGFTTAVISLTLTFRGYKPLLNTTFYSRNLSDESYNTPYGHASTSTLYNYGYNSYNYPYISSYYSAFNNGYSNYYNSDPVYSYESSPYYSSSYYSGYNPGYDSYNPYSSYTYYSPYSSDYRYSQPYYYYSQYSYPSYSSYYPYNYPYSYSYNYPYYNEYSSSSSSVSYSYSYSYTYSDAYHHTVSYSYSYSSWSSQYGSSYSTSTSYNDYSPYYQYPYSSYWFTESTSSPDGSTYTSYNPYTGSRFSSVTYQSPDPNMYREVPSMIFESSKHVDGSSAINMLWSILFFVIQGLLFVAFITQANLLRKNLREKKLLTFDQSILRSEPQKI